MTTPHRIAVDREWKTQGGWVMGIVVIAFGVLFLLHNFGLHLAFLEFNNWWAVLIMFCAIGPLSLAYKHYRAIERIDANIAYYLTSAAAILTVGLIFLLDLRWDRWWPLFVIYGGLWMLVRRTYRTRNGSATDDQHDTVE
ncbi:MAG: hypothetical protein WCB49_13960 [Gammaproteobacteria bacterium]